MIYGIGTDIVFIPRILKAYQRFGPKFVNKVLHDSEKQAFLESKSPERFLASRYWPHHPLLLHYFLILHFSHRWCSKEALYKAMKTPGLNFNEIIIGHSKTNDFTGIPFPSFVGNTKKVIDPLNLSVCPPSLFLNSLTRPSIWASATMVIIV